jgi:hypothetical protein
MNKKILIAVVIVTIILLGGLFLLNSEEATAPSGEENQEEMSSLIDCLAENDLVIYGSRTCPACQQLVASLGGYEMTDPIYVECNQTGCTKEQQQCRENAETGYVPEIQINGEVYDGFRDPSSLAEKVGCQY